MNRKFIIVSVSIFVISLAFIIGFKFVLGDKISYIDANDFDRGEAIIKYVGFEENENVYKIKIKIKNSSNYYARFSDINLQFSNNSNYRDSNPIFKGYDEGMREFFNNYREGDEDNYRSYLEPKEEREYVFDISKGLKFDEDIFDTNRISISYNCNYYRYRIKNNILVENLWGISSAEFLDNSIDPYKIE